MLPFKCNFKNKNLLDFFFFFFLSFGSKRKRNLRNCVTNSQITRPKCALHGTRKYQTPLLSAIKFPYHGNHGRIIRRRAKQAKPISLFSNDEKIGNIWRMHTCPRDGEKGQTVGDENSFFLFKILIYCTMYILQRFFGKKECVQNFFSNFAIIFNSNFGF